MKRDLLKKQVEFMQSTAPVVGFVGGIGSGKTFIASEKAVLSLIHGKYIIATSQSYKQLEVVLFAEIKERLREYKLPYKESKKLMMIELPQTGGVIYGFSDDSSENIRGITADMAIMDEASLQSHNTYEIIQGRLRRGTDPQIFLTTSPRGTNNWVYDEMQKEDSHLITQSIFENYFLPKAYINMLVRDYQGDFALQELEGKFIDSEGYDQLVSLGQLKASQERFCKRIACNRVAALDVARFGGDNSQIMMREGNSIYGERAWSGKNLVELSEEVIAWCVMHNPEVLVVDGTGVGGGVVDILKDRLKGSIKVIEFNGASKAQDPVKYSNSRAETWHSMATWIKNEGVVPTPKSENEKKAIEQITKISYFMDSRGRIALESKESLRRKGEKSPDWGDALSMTFVHTGLTPKKKIAKRRRSYAGFVG